MGGLRNRGKIRIKEQIIRSHEIKWDKVAEAARDREESYFAPRPSSQVWTPPSSPCLFFLIVSIPFPNQLHSSGAGAGAGAGCETGKRLLLTLFTIPPRKSGLPQVWREESSGVRNTGPLNPQSNEWRQLVRPGHPPSARRWVRAEAASRRALWSCTLVSTARPGCTNLAGSDSDSLPASKQRGRAERLNP